VAHRYELERVEGRKWRSVTGRAASASRFYTTTSILVPAAIRLPRQTTF